ncbi:MAG: ribonuclease P protein component [Clostridia bacterium]|nr:ribonuclease P protein component [Clostridia bacterium]
MKFHAICENHLYSKAYSKGKRAVTPTVAVYVLPDLKAEALRRQNPEKVRINRIGLTVSKKLGGAVVRNRVKRILREGLRQVMREHGIKTGYLIVIAARERAVTKKSTRIARELTEALSKLGMLRDAL